MRATQLQRCSPLLCCQTNILLIMRNKKHPKRIRFFVADDIRIDDKQKPLVLGLFVDDQILVELSSDPTRESPISLQAITILASLIDCRGQFEVETSLYGPDGSPIFEAQKIDGGVSTSNTDMTSSGNINLILKFSPFTVISLGTYRLDLKIDRKMHSYEFKVIKRS